MLRAGAGKCRDCDKMRVGREDRARCCWHAKYSASLMSGSRRPANRRPCLVEAAAGCKRATAAQYASCGAPKSRVRICGRFWL